MDNERNSALDCRTSKKKASDLKRQAVILSTGAATDDETLSRLLVTRMVNQALGGAFVGPGDIDELQDELIDACRVIVQEVPRLREEKRPKPKKGKPWRT